MFPSVYCFKLYPIDFEEFLDASAGEESPCSAGDTRDTGSVPGLGRSLGGGHGSAPQYSCLENSHGLRSLTDYSPKGHKESDTTEQLSTIYFDIL